MFDKPAPSRWAALSRLPVVLALLLAVCAAALLLVWAGAGNAQVLGFLGRATPPEAPAVGPTSAEELVPVLAGALERLQSGEARLVFYHLHKAGGSSMCRAMVQAQKPLMGCQKRHRDQVVVSTHNSKCNCNGNKDLLPSIFATGAPIDEMEAYLRDRKPACFFNEQGVADQPYWGPKVVHVIVVRQPIYRYMSDLFHHLTALHRGGGAPLNISALDSSAEALAAVARARGDPAFVPDNAITRYAGGYSRKPSDMVTADHYHAALRNLQRMQVVLVLEEVDEAAGLLEALGLRPYAAETRAGTQASLLGKHEQLSPEAYAAVATLHHWDLLLYDWCLQRHRQTVEAFRRLSR